MYVARICSGTARTLERAVFFTRCGVLFFILGLSFTTPGATLMVRSATSRMSALRRCIAFGFQTIPRKRRLTLLFTRGGRRFHVAIGSKCSAARVGQQAERTSTTQRNGTSAYKSWLIRSTEWYPWVFICGTASIHPF